MVDSSPVSVRRRISSAMPVPDLPGWAAPPLAGFCVSRLGGGTFRALPVDLHEIGSSKKIPKIMARKTVLQRLLMMAARWLRKTAPTTYSLLPAPFLVSPVFLVPTEPSTRTSPAITMSRGHQFLTN